MSYFLEASAEIDKGFQGKAVHIPILGFPKINDMLAIDQKMYTIVGGQSGTGKTSFVDAVYVLEAYQWYMAHKNISPIRLKIIYRSMERSRSYKIAKWIALQIFLDKKVIVDVSSLLGRKSRISQEIYDWVQQYQKYFEEMEEVVEIIDGPENPTGIYNHAVKYALNNGTLFKAIADIDVTATIGSNTNVVGVFSKDKFDLDSTGSKIYYVEVKAYGKTYKIRPYSHLYILANPDAVVEVIEDHLGNLKRESRDGHLLDEKGNLDKMSEYNRILRDTYHQSPVAVVQFNRGLEDTIRRVKTDLSPLPSDFKGSGNMYEDCDVALGLFNPWKLKDYGHMGYQINKFVKSKGDNRFRSVTVLKNSYGIDDVAVGLNFIGENGYFGELPRADQIGENYSKYLW